MSKTYTMQVVANVLGGRLVGDGARTVRRVTHPAELRDAQDLALAVDDKLLPLLDGTTARAAIVGAKATVPDGILDAYVIVDRPRLAMARLTQLFAEPVGIPTGIHPTAVVDPSATLGDHVTIGPHCYVGPNAVIGANSVLHPQTYVGPNAVIGRDALIHAGVRIGDRVVIGERFIAHFNASIGADGFSFVTPQLGSVEEAKQGGGASVSASNDELVRIASLGIVVIGDDVEIGANTSIDRGTIAATRIGNGTKIDNQVQIGHNVTIGDNCLICGRVGIAGSAVIGHRVVLGGAVGVADHVHVGDGAIAMAMSGIAGHVSPRAVVGGAPAVPRDRLVENIFNVGRIKQLMKKINTLSDRLDKVEGGG